MKLEQLATTTAKKSEKVVKDAKPKVFKVTLCKADIKNAQKAIKSALNGTAKDEITIAGKAYKASYSELTYSDNTAATSKARLAFRKSTKGIVGYLVFPKKVNGKAQYGTLLDNEIFEANENAKKSHYIVYHK